MSVIREMFRSVPTQPDAYNGYDGLGSQGTYGMPGYGHWDAGMVWRPGDRSKVGVFESMQLSAVFACLRLLSEAIATLPLDTYIRKGGARQPFRPRPDYLNFAPPGTSRIDYLSQVMLSLLTNGNAYVLTPRNAQGVVIGLVVLDPSVVEVTRENGVTKYEALGTQMQPWVDVMHLKGMTMPGAVAGLSPIGYARESVGLGLAAQRFGRDFFENGALPSAVIEAPKRMTQEAADRWRETWNARHTGSGNQQRLGVLTEGAKLTKVSIQPEDAQFLQTRQFQVPDIARIFGVPPHLIADASNSTSWGSGLAEQNTAFGQFALRPWIERIEEPHSRLLTTDGLPDVFLKLNLDALLRADTQERYDAYARAIEWHFMTPNEARALEDMPPLPGGDKQPDPVIPQPTPKQFRSEAK